MVLGQPHGLDAHALGFCGDAEAVLEGLLVGNVVPGQGTQGTVRSAWGVLRPDAEWATLARERASREVNLDYNRFHGKEGHCKVLKQEEVVPLEGLEPPTRNLGRCRLSSELQGHDAAGIRG